MQPLTSLLKLAGGLGRGKESQKLGEAEERLRRVDVAVVRGGRVHENLLILRQGRRRELNRRRGASHSHEEGWLA